MAARVKFMGGEMESGYIPAFVEAEVVGFAKQEERVFEGGRKSEPAFDIVLSTAFESFSATCYGEALPRPLEEGEKYLFVLGIRNNSSGLATQPKVMVVSYRPGALLTKAFKGEFSPSSSGSTPPAAPPAGNNPPK